MPATPTQTTPPGKADEPTPKLPHERDQSEGEVATQPDPQIVQAQRDLDAGLDDTDMRATPGLDAERPGVVTEAVADRFALGVGRPPGERDRHRLAG